MGKGKRKRPAKRVSNTGQRGFGFGSEAIERAGQAVGDDRFKDDDPQTIFFGEQRLDAYLRGAGMEWVLELRRVLGQLDYGLLTAQYSERGRQAFHPRTVLGLILYGLFVRRVTLRDLERLSQIDMGALWMCGGHRIDHSTISRFVLRHREMLSSKFFESVTAWVVREVGLRAGTSSIDGTVVESAGSHWRAIGAEAAARRAEQAQKEAEAEPEDVQLRESAAAAQHVADVARERCERREAQGKNSASVLIVPSDPDAVIQPRKDGAQRPGYKPTTLMHESGVIIGQYVHPSSETAAVAPLLEQHERIFAKGPVALLIDAGFHSGPLLRELVEREIDVLCPSGQAMGKEDWEKKGHPGLYAKSVFRYAEERNAYECPAGQWLSCVGKSRDGGGRDYRTYRTSACSQCALRAHCTKSKRGRSIKRYTGDEFKEAMGQVLEQPGARKLYRRRMAIAEPVHAEMRERFGLRRFQRRGLLGSRVEFALCCVAINLKKALTWRLKAVFFVLRIDRGTPPAPPATISVVAWLSIAVSA